MGSFVVVFKRGQCWHYENDFGIRLKVNRQQVSERLLADIFLLLPFLCAGQVWPAPIGLKRIATVTLLVARQTVLSQGPTGPRLLDE